MGKLNGMDLWRIVLRQGEGFYAWQAVADVGDPSPEGVAIAALECEDYLMQHGVNLDPSREWSVWERVA